VAFTPQGTAEFRGAKDLIDAICYDVIDRRHRTPAEQRPRDLLTMLIESGSDADALNRRQLRDEMVTMLIGGHETTAVALAWSWKALAEHPDIERRLHAEVDQARAGEATEPLSGLAWGRAIFQESMRLYPPVWYAARVAINDGVIDGYSIPRGACVLISAWVTHRHTAFWNQPERFAPDRFLDTDQPFHREAYLPFGGGRHTCLGMHFALLEGTLILAELSRRFCVRPTNADEVRTHPGITLRQSPGLRARIEIRATEPVRDPVP
jgi:cytochrome P450